MSDIPFDLVLLGWTQRGSQLFAPGIPLSICMNSFPPPECYNVARDQPWHAAEVGARWEDAKKPKPKKAKRVPVVDPAEDVRGALLRPIAVKAADWTGTLFEEVDDAA